MSHRYKRSIRKNIEKFMNSMIGVESSDSIQKKEEENLPTLAAPSGSLETPVDRFSIVKYCPSQVVFVKDSICTGTLEYLKSRPLIVMRVHAFTNLSSITCITCGSSGDMHGINLRLNGITGDYNKITQAHPWAVVGLSNNDIASSAGFIREDDFAAIRAAFIWHMTGEGDRPKYLDERETIYNQPPARVQRSIYGQMEKRSSTHIQIIPPLSQGLEETTLVPPPIVVRENNPGVPQKPSKEYSLIYDANGKLAELGSETTNVTPLTAKAELIINSLTDSETAQVLGRVMKVDDLIKVYHCSKGTAAIVRTFITAEATTKENIARILKRTSKSKRNVALLNHTDRVTLSTWIPASVSGFTEEYLAEIQRQEGVNEVKNGRAWEGYRAIRSQIARWFDSEK